jgi:hypothetical protein
MRSNFFGSTTDRTAAALVICRRCCFGCYFRKGFSFQTLKRVGFVSKRRQHVLHIDCKQSAKLIRVPAF